MDFNSLYFITLFFPVVFAVFFMIHIFKRKLAIYFITASSLFFYFLLEPDFSFLLLIVVGINFILSKFIYQRYKKVVFGAGLAFNLCILLFYKFIPVLYHKGVIVSENITLPIGISFISFSLISYLADCYKGKINGNNYNFFDFAGYVYLFPKVMQGPITRFDEYLFDVRNGKPEVFEGIVDFTIGLGKKVIISSPLGYIADRAFGLHNYITTGWAWFGAISFTLQIYYDFSGYSDMAIGLGKIFGFQFRENFRYPYMSQSPGEFWRCWHITLGGWFKEYVYFPLGGNRCSLQRNALNLFIVWILTGLWHGLGINFIIWGLYWFALLLIEKLFGRHFKSFPGWFKNIVTMFFVIIGWVIFKTESFIQLSSYLRAMFGIGEINHQIYSEIISWQAWLRNYRWYYLVAVFFAMPVAGWIRNKITLQKSRFLYFTYKILAMIAVMLIFVVNIALLVKGTYSPFIYHQF